MRTGIIDTGGGLRGIFGAGVFDRLLDDGIFFNDIYGVSAGAANAVTYIAGQARRTIRFYRDYASRPRYMGFSNLLKTGSFIGLPYIYRTLSNSDGEDPLNFENIKKFQGNFTTVATNADTGKPVYFDKSSYKQDDYTVLMASCCLPAVCKPVFIGDIPYYDGGAADPIPIRRAFNDGCDRLVLILTRPKNEKHTPTLDSKAAALIKKSYPETAEILKKRYMLYNNALEEALGYEKQGKILIIAPDSSKGMGTLTKDKQKLTDLYNEGYSKAAEIAEFLKTT